MEYAVSLSKSTKKTLNPFASVQNQANCYKMNQRADNLARVWFTLWDFTKKYNIEIL